MTRTLALACALLASCGERKPDPPAGATEAEAAEAAPPAAPTATTEQLEQDATAKVNEALAAYAAAQRDADRAAAKAKLAGLERAHLEQLERFKRATADLAAKVDEARAAVDAARDDAGRTAAAASLADLRLEHARSRARLHGAMEAAVRSAKLRPPPRPPGAHAVPEQCLDNPLAKGCS